MEQFINLDNIIDQNIIDKYFMDIALSIAGNSLYTTFPNPNVGCLIVYNKRIIGYGWHIKPGTNHAEINAIESAIKNGYEDKLKLSDIYVTLEPCSHYGRTGPCSVALVKYNFKRVIVACLDPNPLVSGKGIKILKDGNVKVTILNNNLVNKTINLNRSYFKYIQNLGPFIRIKLATSIDYKIALNNKDSKWITNKKSRSIVQAIRLMSDAIITTSKTVIIDNANYNVRYDELPTRVKNNISLEEIKQPLIIILDKDNKLTHDLNIFKNDSKKLVISSSNHNLSKLMIKNTEFINLDTTNEKIVILIDLLHKKYNINNILVESGANLMEEFIKYNLYDELHHFVGSKLLGRDAISSFLVTSTDSINTSLSLKLTSSTIIDSSDLYNIYCKMD